MLENSNDECTTTLVGTCVVAYWYMQAYIFSKTRESIHTWSADLRPEVLEEGISQLDSDGDGSSR